MPRKSKTTFLGALGARVAAARKAAELTQEELAERLGVAVATWSRWERGHVALSLERLHEVAQILDVGLGDLLDVQRPAPYSDTERRLLRDYRSMDGTGQELALALVAEVRRVHGRPMQKKRIRRRGSSPRR